MKYYLYTAFVLGGAMFIYANASQADIKLPAYKAAGTSQVESLDQGYYLIEGKQGTKLDGLRGALADKPVYRCQLQVLTEKATLKNAKVVKKN